jgi:cation:H+ antiporter
MDTVRSGVLLVASCLPYSRIETVFTEGGRFPSHGYRVCRLLIVYLYLSFRWARKDKAVLPKSDLEAVDKGSVALIVLKIAVGIAVVIVSSKILIPAVQETAHRLRIPEGIIAATLVAFGTSLPELFTAISAVRKGHGEIALGNIIGATF